MADLHHRPRRPTRRAAGPTRGTGALTREQFAAALHRAGLVDVEITETHRVHEHAASAIVRAGEAPGA
jgi:hypothetical protein